MHHLGKKEFYDDVAGKVEQFKKDGYVVYYELLGTSFNADSTERDVIRRKGRKIKGFSGGYKDASENRGMFKKYVEQPSYKDMGTDSNDVRADIDYKILINEYEKKYGKIILDSIDLNTGFDAEYDRKQITDKSQYEYIIIDYRNDFLVHTIKNSTDRKILVLYGEGHRKNFEGKIK